MKKAYLAILFALSIPCLGGDPSPGQYMSGSISRDLQGAMKRAQQTGKPTVIIAYDPKNKEMQGPETANQYSLRCFFEIPETRKLLAANFIQVFAPWSARGVDAYLDPSDKTGLPVAIFLDRSGKFIKSLPCKSSPTDALMRVQEIISGL